MDNPEESKFGMTRAQLIQGFKDLKAAGVKEFGIHSFLASNTVTNDYYPELVRQLFTLAVELKEESGIELSFINLSGGIGVNYRPEEKENDIVIIGEGVRKVYEEVLTPNGLGFVKIFTELGRFMLAPRGLLVTKVLHRKKTYRDYVGVDASAVNLLRPAMYGSYYHITNMTNSEGAVEVVDVVGSLCENNDKFAKERELPAEILLQEDGSARMIRRAETPEDYFATLYGFDFEE